MQIREVKMGKIIIKVSNNRPQVKFKGEITNEDIIASRRVLDFYLPKKRQTQNINEIDIPLGDCNGEE